MFQVLGGQQDLGGVMAAGPKGPLVGFDQQALADGGDRLEMGQIRGARRSAPTDPCPPPQRPN